MRESQRVCDDQCLRTLPHTPQRSREQIVRNWRLCRLAARKGSAFPSSGARSFFKIEGLRRAGKAALPSLHFFIASKSRACATPTDESTLSTRSAALAFEALRLFELFQIDAYIDQKWNCRRAKTRALRYN
jgi:hypothetical protein